MLSAKMDDQKRRGGIKKIVSDAVRTQEIFAK